MPNFASYENDIATQQNGNAPATHEQMKNLIDWYGAALHQLVEHGDTTKRGANPLILPNVKRLTVSPDPQGKIKKNPDAQALEAFLNAWVDQAGSIAPAANSGIPAYCGREKNRFNNLAMADEFSAKAAVNAGQADEGSELYVDAAIEMFRAALCIYHEHKTDLVNKAFAQRPARKAAEDFAAAMTRAAELLNDAATNEAPGDTAEIIAELMLAKVFLASAQTMLTALQNSNQLPANEKPAVAAAVTKANTDDAAVNTALNPHLK